MEKIVTISGKYPGKTLTIMGGVHGNEVCGVEVIKELRRNLKINCGTVYLIFGNPLAIDKNVRQIDCNLNRLFQDESKLSDEQKNSYEYKRAKKIMPYLAKSDAVLDLHSSGTKDSPPFVICESNSYSIVKYFSFEKVTSGWDPLEPGGTDAYVDKQGGKGICVECGNHNDFKAIETARKTAQIFLQVMGVIKKNEFLVMNENQKYIQMANIYITKNNFKPARKFADFEKLIVGEVIGWDGKEELKSSINCYILFARKRNQINEEAYLLGVKK